MKALLYSKTFLTGFGTGAAIMAIWHDLKGGVE